MACELLPPSISLNRVRSWCKLLPQAIRNRCAAARALCSAARSGSARVGGRAGLFESPGIAVEAGVLFWPSHAVLLFVGGMARPIGIE